MSLFNEMLYWYILYWNENRDRNKCLEMASVCKSAGLSSTKPNLHKWCHEVALASPTESTSDIRWEPLVQVKDGVFY